MWYILNYTNPMAMLCKAMQTYTSVDVTGLCHSVQVCSESLLKNVGMEDKLEGRKELIAGINHMAWLLEIRDKDVISVTESIVARAQGNYASVDAIAEDVRRKLGGETIGVIFPILSRNRFAICLRGIAKGAKKIVLMLSYPSDEVGNHLITLDQIDEAGVNPYSDILTLERYRELFGENVHEFTGVDYVQYYGDLIRAEGTEVEIIFANNPRVILNYTKNVLTCDIHTRARTKRILTAAGAERVCGLDDILNESVDGSGCNERFGLLGSNKSTEDTVKLFPRDCQGLVEDIQDKLLKLTGKHIEVMVYGDGAFKDPVGKIWELADPSVSVAHTPGLEGTPNELKLKYLADNDFADLSGEALRDAIRNKIAEKDGTSLPDFYDQVMERTGYADMLKAKDTEENRTRLENIRELKSSILSYLENTDSPTLAGFLEEIALYTDIEEYNDSDDAVVMMTMHSSKGLEFPHVYLVGFEDGLFPGMRSIVSAVYDVKPGGVWSTSSIEKIKNDAAALCVRRKPQLLCRNS